MPENSYLVTLFWVTVTSGGVPSKEIQKQLIYFVLNTFSADIIWFINHF